MNNEMTIVAFRSTIILDSAINIVEIDDSNFADPLFMLYSIIVGMQMRLLENTVQQWIL